jgi:C4-dicarboxylate transporter, DctM subunit
MLLTMLIAFALSISVAVSIGIASLIGAWQADLSFLAVVKEMFSSLNRFPLAAIPFFILAGNLMESGGISARLVEFAKAVVGGIQGGLAATCVLTCMIFAAVSGSSVATTFAIGAILIPALIRHGYPTNYAAALQATSAELGVIIPPSIPMILYGVSAEVSIGELFISGFGPGLLIGVALMVFVVVYARWKGYGKGDRDGRLPFFVATRKAALALMMPVIILGGIYGGVFTPTEAAGVAVIYSLFVTMVVHREVDLRDLWRIIQSALFLISQILMIVTTAGLYSWLLTTSGIPQQIIAEINALHMPAWALLLSLNVVLLIMGSFLEPPAAILIMTPLLLPVVQSVGVDPVHFGIIMAVNLSIGMYTPPFGLNLFASQAVFQTPLGTIYRGVLPFLLINFATLMVITYVPAISMVLLGR